MFSASPWALSERDKWIGWSKEDRSERLSLIVNNTRFLIFPWVKVKNLASKALSLGAKQVIVAWQERYGFKPVLLETFVDTELYQGTCYKAANWIETAGRGRMDRFSEFLSSPKRIYVYPLQSDFQEVLLGKGGEILSQTPWKLKMTAPNNSDRMMFGIPKYQMVRRSCHNESISGKAKDRQYRH